MQILLPWVHIFSFSVWLSANLFVLFMLWPAIRPLAPGERLKVMRLAAGGLNAVVAVAAPLTVLSGLGGFFLPGNAAQLAPGTGAFLVLALKTILTAVMALNHGLQAFRHHSSPEHPPEDRNPWMRLLMINVILGFIILFLGLWLRRVTF